MGIYLIVFSISTFLFWSAAKVKGNQKNFLYAIALFLPCLLAGLRSTNVGTDVNVYLTQIFNAAENTNVFTNFLRYEWFDVWQYKSVYQFEPLFILTVYVVTKLTYSIHCVMFVIEALTIIPFFAAINNVVERKRIWLGMLIFFMFFYNASLNTMRQSIGLSLLFLGLVYLKKGDKKKYITFQILAILFHYSSVVGIGLYCCMRIFEKSKKLWKTTFGFVLVGFAFLIFHNSLGSLFNLVGLSRFAAYISGKVAFMPNQVIVRAPLLVLFIFNWRKLKHNRENYFYLSMLIYAIIFAQFSSINIFAARLSMYFMIYYTFTVVELDKIRIKNININTIFVIIYSILYWWYYYVLFNVAETVPYAMFIN